MVQADLQLSVKLHATEGPMITTLSCFDIATESLSATFSLPFWMGVSTSGRTLAGLVMEMDDVGLCRGAQFNAAECAKLSHIGLLRSRRDHGFGPCRGARQAACCQQAQLQGADAAFILVHAVWLAAKGTGNVSTA
jgi:hypothetical protein